MPKPSFFPLVKLCHQVPAHVEELFNDPQCNRAAWWDGPFWLLVKSLREFVKQNPSHQLPLSGVLPDMKSDTKNYIQMQHIYRRQAYDDLQTFRKILLDVRQTIEDDPDDDDAAEKSDNDTSEDKGYKEYKTDMGHYTDGPELTMPSEMVKTFVKNSAHIRLIRGRRSDVDPKDLRKLHHLSRSD